MAELDKVVAGFMKLSPEEREAFMSALRAQGIDPEHPAKPPLEPEEFELKRFKDGRFCPHCGSRHVVRNGKQKDGTQRYRCEDCHKTFQSSTKTVLGRNTFVNAQTLRKYVHCMCLELPVRKCAEECGISIPTAFAWRHKILDALAETYKAEVLSGVIEYDETFFYLSFKGHRLMESALEKGIPLPSHKRGGDLVRKGTSNRLVCVPVAVSRDGGFIGKVSNLGNPRGSDVVKVLSGHCQAGSTLCADGGRPAKRVAKDENLELVALKREQRAQGGIYNIQTVNAFHSGLKNLVNQRFHGVATKYLNNYVVWHGFLHGAGENLKEREETLYNIALFAVCPTNTRELSRRPPVPVLSERQKRFMRVLLLRLALEEMQDKGEAIERLQHGQYSENATEEQIQAASENRG